ncbi:hypothetical protein KY362_04795 [Candidatus Woesearchaeota archaeon]|nr:hypothetical protein [Candidatus Woesearchaeota archaeon]
MEPTQPGQYESRLPDTYTIQPKREPVFTEKVTIDFRNRRYQIGDGEWHELKRARPRPVESIDILADD